MTSFTLFPKLALELRELIWEYACYELRCSILIPNPYLDRESEDLPDNEQEMSFWAESRRVPPLLHTCREARCVGRRRYLLLPFTSTEIYHNPKADSLLFDDNLDEAFHAIRLLARKEYVRHIICTTSIWNLEYNFDKRHRFFNVLCQYENLKKIT